MNEQMPELDQLLKIAVEASLVAGESTLKYYYGGNEIRYKDDRSPVTTADLESNEIILNYLGITNIPILSEESKEVPVEVRKGWKYFWLVDPLDGTKEFIGKRDEYTINIALIIDHEPALGVVYAPALKTVYFAHQYIGSYKMEMNANASTERIINEALRIKASGIPEKIRVVASKSHLNEETSSFIHRLNEHFPVDSIKSYGSSLKLCKVAEGSADIYPRLGPTMEWDIAAGHAVARFANCCVIDFNKGISLQYNNKENLLNPFFLVYNPLLDKAVRSVISLY